MSDLGKNTPTILAGLPSAEISERRESPMGSKDRGWHLSAKTLKGVKVQEARAEEHVPARRYVVRTPSW
jgi:hypothetical protein